MPLFRRLHSLYYQLQIYSSIRQATGALLPAVVIGGLFNQFAIGVAMTVGAFCLAMIDQFGGRRQDRIKEFWVASVLCTLVAFIASLSSSYPLLLLATVAVVCFCCALLNVFGPRWGLVALSGLFVLILNIRAPTHGSAILWNTLYTFLGTQFYLLYTLFVRHFTYLNEERRAVYGAYLNTATYLHKRAALFDMRTDLAHAYDDMFTARAAMTAQFQTAADVLLSDFAKRRRKNLPEHAQLEHLLVQAINIADTMIATQTDYKVLREHLGQSRFIELCQQSIHELGLAVHQLAEVATHTNKAIAVHLPHTKIQALTTELTLYQDGNSGQNKDLGSKEQAGLDSSVPNPMLKPELRAQMLQIMRRIRKVFFIVQRIAEQQGIATHGLVTKHKKHIPTHRHAHSQGLSAELSTTAPNQQSLGDKNSPRDKGVQQISAQPTEHMNKAEQVTAAAEQNGQERMADIRAVIQHSPSTAVSPQKSFSWKLLSSNLNLRSPNFRYALRLTLAGLLGLLVPLALSTIFSDKLLHTAFTQRSYWVLLTLVLIMKPGFALTRQRNKRRLIGTLIGCVIAFVLFHLHPSNTFLFVLMWLLYALALCYLPINYLYGATFVTVFVMVAFYFLHEAGTFVIEERLVDTLVGCGLALLLSYVLPSWESSSIKSWAQSAIDANLRLIQQTEKLFCHMAVSQSTEATQAANDRPATQDTQQTEPIQTAETATTNDINEAWQQANIDAELALSNFSAAFQRMMSEPPTHQEHVAEYNRIMVQLLVVNAQLAALQGQLTSPQAQATTLATPLATTDLKAQSANGATYTQGTTAPLDDTADTIKAQQDTYIEPTKAISTYLSICAQRLQQQEDSAPLPSLNDSRLHAFVLPLQQIASATETIKSSLQTISKADKANTKAVTQGA